jgi:predicted nucleic acid-binding protein
MMYCLDANIWVYYLDETLTEHPKVTDAVEAVLEDGPLFTTTVLQMEVVHYLHTQLTNGAERIDQFLALESVEVADLTTADVATAVDILDTHPESGVGRRDATVVAAMDRRDVTELWTHDAGLRRLGDRLDWLTVLDPVESTDPLSR